MNSQLRGTCPKITLLSTLLLTHWCHGFSWTCQNASRSGTCRCPSFCLECCFPAYWYGSFLSFLLVFAQISPNQRSLLWPPYILSTPTPSTYSFPSYSPILHNIHLHLTHSIFIYASNRLYSAWGYTSDVRCWFYLSPFPSCIPSPSTMSRSIAGIQHIFFDEVYKWMND